MAVFTTINDPSVHFQANEYTGNGNDDKVITNYGNSNLQPDFIWFKQLTGSTRDNIFIDSKSGVTKNFRPNTSDAQYTNSNYVKSLDADGFTLGTSNRTNDADDPFTAWQWKANGGTQVTNSDGGTDSYLQVNSTAGFVLGKYTAPGSTGTTVGHGLGAIPDFFFAKDFGSGGWYGMWPSTFGGNQSTGLNTTDGFGTVSGYSSFTSSTFVQGQGDSDNHMFWAWKNTPGYFHASYYKSNNNADGPFQYCGFKPALVWVKGDGGGVNWRTYGDQRMGYNPKNAFVSCNSDAEETNATNAEMEFYSNGFKLTAAEGDANYNEMDVAFAAWAANPFMSSTGVPTTGR